MNTENPENLNQEPIIARRLTILERDGLQRDAEVSKGAAVLSAIGAATCIAMFFAYLNYISGGDLNKFADFSNLNMQDIISKILEKVSTWQSLKKLAVDLGPIGVVLPIAALDFFRNMVNNAGKYLKSKNKVDKLDSILSEENNEPQMGGK